jgi:ribonuclease HII
MKSVRGCRFEDLVLYDRRKSVGVPGFIAGVDEAGRGALAGPVVAAAVICSPCGELCGVRDSKLLTEKSRERIYELIAGRCVALSTGVVDHDEIDRTNILRATLKAMKLAVEGLAREPSLVLVDGRNAPATRVRCEPVVNGDSISFTVAAASVIAKVTRDRIMRLRHEQYPLYGFERNKGYGTRMHREAIARFGRSPIHRRSFRAVI